MAIADSDIRQPAVAGQFYTSDPKQLRKQVDEFLKHSKLADIHGDVVALIAPHAGLLYSGQTAANAYKQIEGKKYDAVVVIAPSHYDGFSGVSVYNKGGYATPLGVIPVNVEIANAIINQDEIIYFTVAGHRQEHAVEVQLPFLQRTMEDLTVVPIVMVDRSNKTCKRLADAIVKASKGKKILIVASSDFYHGYSYDECKRMDAATLKQITEFDPEKLCEGLERDFYQACGGGPITVALMATRKLGADSIDLLAHTNSNDVIGKVGGYVVGYAALIVSKKKLNNKRQEVGIEVVLNAEEKKTLLRIARETIRNRVLGKKPPKLNIKSGMLRKNCGAFVTINKHTQLRGCIGYVEGFQPLYLTVQEVAESAALRDPRFSPVSCQELDEIEIEISVLTPPSVIEDVNEIEVGKHGIIIKKGDYQGLLLPQVATEYGWDREKFLEHTCIKAGLAKDAWKDSDAEIRTFSAEVFGEEEA